MTRIDATRRDVADAKTALDFLLANLEDLHVLAYNRHKAAQVDKVRGGSRDYALDTHGDQDARDLYRDSTKIAGKVIDETLRLSAEVLDYLNTGTGGSRKDTTHDCSTDEIIEQLRNRQQRRHRGEYEPELIAQQPTVLPSMDWKTECEVLRSAVRKVTAEFAQDHEYCEPPDEGPGRFKRKLLRRYPTKNLSTKEREAWKRAQSVAAVVAPKAS